MAAHLFIKVPVRQGSPTAPTHDVWINRDHVRRVERITGSLTRALVTFDNGDTFEVEGTPVAIATAFDT